MKRAAGIAAGAIFSGLLASSMLGGGREASGESLAFRMIVPGVASNPLPTPTPPQPNLPACTWARVISVVDGDTIRVSISGITETVRYIGVDTPETVAPGTPVQPFGPEASELNKQLVLGQDVCLERDISEHDRYGRLLRYVWLHDGRMVNEELLLAGLAVVDTYPPDVKYTDSRFLPAQRAAQQANRGLWYDFEPKPTPGPGNCDPAYPTVCIPPAPPDLDCGDITHRRFVVLPPDPHRFDGDKNGIGCESG